MMYRFVALLTICFVGFVMVAGCMSQDETITSVEPVDEVQPTFTVFQSITTETEEINDEPFSVTEDNGLFDLPLSPPPTNLMVSVSAEKDPIYNTITVRFDGGRGQDIVSSALVGVTLSDGHTELQELVPTSGSTVSFQGSAGMDVVEVVISYMNGESYKVLLEAVGFIRPSIDLEPVKTQEAVVPGDGGYRGPVTAPPNNVYISVNVSKDPVYKTITTTFGGGLGQNLVQKIDVFVMLSNGSFFEDELEPRLGATVVTDGTNGTDRVQVVVAYVNGETYKIVDAELGSRGGIATN
ncbi:MAG: hypothetical protein FWF19_05360 [Euryarchaeota archaeon]|nr:hypothetical protein [Euryarchaeota archaeon]